MSALRLLHAGEQVGLIRPHTFRKVSRASKARARGAPANLPVGVGRPCARTAVTSRTETREQRVTTTSPWQLLKENPCEMSLPVCSRTVHNSRRRNTTRKAPSARRGPQHRRRSRAVVGVAAGSLLLCRGSQSLQRQQRRAEAVQRPEEVAKACRGSKGVLYASLLGRCCYRTAAARCTRVAGH